VGGGGSGVDLSMHKVASARVVEYLWVWPTGLCCGWSVGFDIPIQGIRYAGALLTFPPTTIHSDLPPVRYSFLFR